MIYTYTTTEAEIVTKVVEHRIKPSQIYTVGNAREAIEKHLTKGYRIVDFRSPAIGEWFINANCGRICSRHNSEAGYGFSESEPRFIVEPPPTSTLESWWE